MRAVHAKLLALAAAGFAGERDNRSLQPTALVPEGWLRRGSEHQPSWRSCAHFFSAAAEAMRRILIDRGRSHHRARHGGGRRAVPREATDVPGEEAAGVPVLAVDEALERFARLEPERAHLVKLR